MATTGAFPGKDLILYLNGTAVALSKECAISIARDEMDITSKDSAYAYGMLPGQYKVTITGSGFYTVAAGTSKTLIDAIKAGTSFAWKVSTNVSADNYMHGAMCYVTSTDFTGAMTDASQISYSITVSGVLSYSAKT